MTGRQVLLLGTSLVASFSFWPQHCSAAESVGGPIVRIAELEIDPGQLEAYKLALKDDSDMKLSARHMTKAQIAEAQRRAEDWIKRHKPQPQNVVARAAKN